MNKAHPSARGVALVSVLLVVAVATALAYEMMTRHALDVARSQLLFDASQARQYALGGEEYARQLLHQDWEEEGTRAKDTLLEAWTLCDGPVVGEARTASDGTAGAFEIENGALAVCVEDLRGRFNLNALLGTAAAEHIERFKRLLQLLQLDASIADAWVDWIDADQIPTGMGLEDSDYLARSPAHRAANQPAVHISEFLVAAALSAEESARLRPHVTTLARSDLLVNVNTATSVVLASLGSQLGIADAQILAQAPRDYDTVQAVLEQHAKLGESDTVLAVTSDFFLVRAKAEVRDARAELTSVIHRDAGSGQLRVVSRSFGDRFDRSAENSGAQAS